jgi:hypothetical protein
MNTDLRVRLGQKNAIIVDIRTKKMWPEEGFIFQLLKSLLSLYR